jgi:hypothetical protein
MTNTEPRKPRFGLENIGGMQISVKAYISPENHKNTRPLDQDQQSKPKIPVDQKYQ